MMKKLTRAALLAAATAFLLAGFPACSSDDNDPTPIEDSTGGTTDGTGGETTDDSTTDGTTGDDTMGGNTGTGDNTGTGGGTTGSDSTGGDTGNESGNTGSTSGQDGTGGDQGDDEGENPGEATTATVTVVEGFVDRTSNDFSYRPTAEGTVAGGNVLDEVSGFKLALADGTKSYTISSNNKSTPDDSNYKLAYRVKLGGNAKFENGTVQQALVVTAEKPCMVTFYVRSSGSSKKLTFQPFAADGTKLIANMSENVDPTGSNGDITYVVSFNMTSGTYYFGASEGGPGICGVDVKFVD